MVSNLRLAETNILRIKEEQNRKRQNVIEYYQEFLPHIKDYINWVNITPGPVPLLAQIIRQNDHQIIYKVFSQTMLDFRFHKGPVEVSALSLYQTDNHTNNEIKNIARNLIRKGWKYKDVAFELERIYGSGVILNMDGFDFENPDKKFFKNAGLLLLTGGFFIIYRIFQKGKKK
jgi:hypothetical protein